MTLTDSAYDQNGQVNKFSWDSTIYNPKPRLELLRIKPNRDNYFNTIVNLDSSDAKKWEADIVADSRFYFDLITKTPQLVLLDSSISVKNIDGVNLQKEYFQLYNTVTKDTTYSYKFSRKYKNYSINMNVRYKDKELGNKLLEIINTSKFAP